MSKWIDHRNSWISCKRCPLHETRTNVVLVRGTLPCDILFVGEAPGASEDVLGKPFIGPAGKLLDRIISKAVPKECTYALTNLIACIPLGDEGDKVAEPPKWAIETCAPRLRQLLTLATPRLIVNVGSLATKWVPKIFADHHRYPVRTVDLVHPAAILRMSVAQQGFAIQKCVVSLADRVQDIEE